MTTQRAVRSWPAFVLVGCLAALLPSLTGCHEAASSQAEEGSEDATAEPIAVKTAVVGRANLDVKVNALGVVVAQPGGREQISNAIEGQVVKVLVAEGDKVVAGQPIARLDDRLARIDLADKQAARDELAATVATLKAPPREPERLQADLDVRRAQVAKQVAQAALARLEPLASRNEVSQQQLYEASERVRDAELAEQAAEQRRKALLQGPTPEAVREAEAKVARAETAVAGMETRLEYYTLAAPRAGVVNRLTVNPGQWLPIGTLVAELVDTNQVLVQVGVPASEATRVAVGQMVAVSIPSARSTGGDKPLDGEVAFVGLEAQAGNGLVPVNIRVDNASGRLRLSTVAAANVVVATAADVLTVPEAAVVPAEDGDVVMAVRDGTIAVVPVTVGTHDRGLVELKSADLHENDTVVVGGAYNLPEGTPVETASDETADSEQAQP